MLEDKEEKARHAEICYGRREGTYADSTDCTAYFFCANGITYHMRCPKGTIWSQRMRGCAFASSSNVAACHKMAAQLARTSRGKYDIVSSDARQLMDDDVSISGSALRGQVRPETASFHNKIPSKPVPAVSQLPNTLGVQPQEKASETVYVADATAAATPAGIKAAAVNNAPPFSSPPASSQPLASSPPSAAASKYNDRKMTVYYEINRPRVAAANQNYGKKINSAVKQLHPAGVGGAASVYGIKSAHNNGQMQLQGNAQGHLLSQKPALNHPPLHHSSHHHFVSHTSTVISSPAGPSPAANSHHPWLASHSQASPGKYNSISPSQHLLGSNANVKKLNPTLNKLARHQLHSGLPTITNNHHLQGHRTPASATAAEAGAAGSKAGNLQPAVKTAIHTPQPGEVQQLPAAANTSPVAAAGEVRLDETAHG